MARGRLIRRACGWLAIAGAGVAACAEPRDRARPPSANAENLRTQNSGTTITASATPSAIPSARPNQANEDASTPEPKRGAAWTAATAADVLAPGGGTLGCEGNSEPVLCLLDRVYRGDDEARLLAKTIFTRSKSLAGVEAPDTLDGGFRGNIRIVPEPPVGTYRKHLAWVAASLQDFDEFFTGVASKDPTAAPPRYRWRALAMRFFRSVDRTTPSAYARGWSVAYNVKGSLNTSADAVRETLFHEVFHLNDADHGDWARRALATDYAAIVKKCRTDVGCLNPYAPGDTKVRGGTYYAFQPNNGEAIREYGAELALRWYREQRAALRGERSPRAAFKCGPPENARAWKAIVDEFFHVDLVPTCR